MYQDFFLNVSKIFTPKFCAIKNATPDPMAIRIEIISEKLVEISKVKRTPIKNPTYTISLLQSFRMLDWLSL